MPRRRLFATIAPFPGVIADAPFAQAAVRVHSRAEDGRIRRRRISQTTLLAGRDGRILVDFVGRYDSLDTDFAFVCRRIGIDPISLGRVNATAHRDHRDYYDARLARLVRDAYAEDIERFGFEFTDPLAARPAIRLAA